MFWITFFTINWLSFCWFKRYFAIFLAIRTNCLVHFSWSEVSSKSAAPVTVSVELVHFLASLIYLNYVVSFYFCKAILCGWVFFLSNFPMCFCAFDCCSACFSF